MTAVYLTVFKHYQSHVKYTSIFHNLNTYIHINMYIYIYSTPTLRSDKYFYAGFKKSTNFILFLGTIFFLHSHIFHERYKTILLYNIRYLYDVKILLTKRQFRTGNCRVFCNFLAQNFEQLAAKMKIDVNSFKTKGEVLSCNTSR